MTRPAPSLWGRAIGLVIHDLRTQSGLSYKRFEEVSGIDRSRIWRLEHKERKIQPETFEQLARGFGITVTEFMAHVETKLAMLRKEKPDPFLATITRRKSAIAKKRKNHSN